MNTTTQTSAYQYQGDQPHAGAVWRLVTWRPKAKPSTISMMITPAAHVQRVEADRNLLSSRTGCG